MLRIALLTAASVLAMASAHAADTNAASPANNSQTAFQNAVHSIKTWFGSDAPITVQPIATNDDTLQAPTPVAGAAAANAVEPAAGDDDMLQVPPPYTGADSLANAQGANAVSPAAGDAPAAAATTDDKKTSCAKDEGDTTTMCDADKASTDMPVDTTTPRAPAEPAAQEPNDSLTPAQPLPSTQPAAGDNKGDAPAIAPAKLPTPAKAQ